MGHLLKIKCVHSRLYVNISDSTSVLFRPATVPVPNLASNWHETDSSVPGTCFVASWKSLFQSPELPLSLEDLGNFVELPKKTTVGKLCTFYFFSWWSWKLYKQKTGFWKSKNSEMKTIKFVISYWIIKTIFISRNKQKYVNKYFFN
jgi:hypothetical protein